MAQDERKIMQVSIYSPDGEIYNHRGRGCRLETTDGGLTVLPGHIPIMTALAVGAVVVKRLDEEEDYIAVDGGVASFNENIMTITAPFAIRARDIDTATVQIEKEEAQAKLYEAEQHANADDYRRAKVALDRAINQINVSKHRKS